MISNVRTFFLFSLITPRLENSRIEIPFPSLSNGREQKRKINQNSNKKKKKEEKENLAERETVGFYRQVEWLQGHARLESEAVFYPSAMRSLVSPAAHRCYAIAHRCPTTPRRFPTDEPNLFTTSFAFDRR